MRCLACAESKGILVTEPVIAKNSHFSLVQAMAEDLGDQDKAKQIQDQLNELEERAEALDRQRTKNISAIRCVTDLFWLGSYPGPTDLATVIR